MPNETIQKIIELGGKRWTKGNMDRIYFSLEVLEKAFDESGEGGRLPMNRFERNNVKAYVDIPTGEYTIQNVGTYNREIKHWLIQYIEKHTN